MNQEGNVRNNAHIALTRPMTTQSNLRSPQHNASTNLSALSFTNNTASVIGQASKGKRPQTSQINVRLPPKHKRHGRLHKMGLINIDDRIEERHQQQRQQRYQDLLVHSPESLSQQNDAGSLVENTDFNINNNYNNNTNNNLVSKSLPSLHILSPSVSNALLPPLRGSRNNSRQASPKHHHMINHHNSHTLSSCSRPGTTLGFGSTSDRKLNLEFPTEKQYSIEELHQLEEMMNPNRPRTSSVQVQIKRYMDDIQTLERNSKLLFANASTNAMKANFTYTGSLDELQETFAREAKTYESISLFAQARYLEMINFEGNDREPTKFKAALSADLMYKLVSSVSRYDQVMGPLLWELCNSIFVDFERVEARFEKDPNSLMLKELVRCPTYLELAHQLHDRLEELTVEAEIANRGMQMKSLVKKFQTLRLAFQQTDIFIRDACFKLWKGHFRRHQRQYRQARLRGLRLRFRQWRQFVTQAHTNLAGMTSGEELSEQLDVKIHRLMALNHNLLQISEQNSENINLSNTTNGGVSGSGVSMPHGKLVRQATQRRNISDDRSPQLISHLLSGSHGSSMDNTPRPPLSQGNISPLFHCQDQNNNNNNNNNNKNNNTVTFQFGMNEEEAGHHLSHIPYIMTGKPLESSDAAIAYMTPHHHQSPPHTQQYALAPGAQKDTQNLNHTLSPDASRPSTAGELLTSRGSSGHGFGNNYHNSSSDSPSRPDTPELMEFSRRQATVAAQQHNIPAHLLTRPPPNAARAIMRHRAAVIGGGLGGHGGKHHRRHRVPQQDASIQASAEDFETVDLQNYRIMLPRFAASNNNNTITSTSSKSKIDTDAGDDFDHNQYMVVVLSPRDQHETHVGNITTQSLHHMTQQMQTIQLQHGISPSCRHNISQSSSAATMKHKPKTGVNTPHHAYSVIPETAAIFLSTTLSMDMVVHLIGAVYEHLFCHYFYDSQAMEEISSVLFVARDVIYRRYHYDRSLAKTIFKEFVRGCLEFVGLSKRIEVFCKISGLIPPDVDDVILENATSSSNLAALTDEAASITKIKLTVDNVKSMNLQEKLHFFILMVSLWSNNIPLVAVNLLLTCMIDREIVLQHIPELFPSLEKQNKVYDQLITTVIDLPCYHAETLRLNHFAEADKIDLDIICDVFLRYEYAERMARQELQTYLSVASTSHDDDDR